MKVAVVDSGIDADHPRVGGVAGAVIVEPDEKAADGVRFVEGPHADLYGHGTACAAIIRGLAPECELYSVRVLGAALTGRGAILAAGIRWAVEHGMDVVNLSLSTRSRALMDVLYELVDQAAFANVMLVSAVNNVPAPSYPSQFSGVFSVAAYPGRDPEHFVVNPEPPVEFGAPGLDIDVAWSDGGSLVATGNSSPPLTSPASSPGSSLRTPASPQPRSRPCCGRWLTTSSPVDGRLWQPALLLHRQPVGGDAWRPYP